MFIYYFFVFEIIRFSAIVIFNKNLRTNMIQYLWFIIWITVLLIFSWSNSGDMKQIFLYLLTLNLALLGAGATWLNSTNIEKLKEKDRKFIQSRRKIFNLVTFTSLIITVTGLISSFIDETRVPPILGLISIVLISFSVLLLGILFIRLQNK